MDDSSVESDFCDVVEYGTKLTFHPSAKLMLGADYAQSGREIIKENRPDLMKRFESYFEGMDANKGPAK